MDRINRELGALDARLMELLWNGGAQRGREICRKLDGPAVPYTTVMSGLERLCRRGLVKRGTGRFSYEAAVTREEYDHRLAAETVQTLLGRNPEAVLSGIVKGVAAADGALLGRLRALVDDHGERREERRAS